MAPSIQSVLQDRILGCLLGQAIGLAVCDLRPAAEHSMPGERAAGWLNWSLNPTERVKRTKTLEDHPTGRMTRALASSVINSYGTPDALWQARVFFELAACKLLDERALGPESSALRSIVATLPLSWLEPHRETLAISQAWATHKSSSGDAYARAVHALVEQCFFPSLPSPRDFLASAAEEIRNLSVPLAFDVCQLIQLLHLPPLAYAELCTRHSNFAGWLLVGTYAFLSQRNLIGALAAAAAICSDASAAAGLTGMLFGACHGALALPDSLVGMLPSQILIEANQIASGLAEHRRAPEMRMA